jgi:hypothetical protein
VTKHDPRAGRLQFPKERKGLKCQVSVVKNPGQMIMVECVAEITSVST